MSLSVVNFSGVRRPLRVRACSAVNWENEILLLKQRMDNLRQKDKNLKGSGTTGTTTFSKGAMATFRKRVNIERFHQNAISSRPALPSDITQIENNIEEIQKIQDWHAEQWKKYAELIKEQEDTSDEDENIN